MLCLHRLLKRRFNACTCSIYQQRWICFAVNIASSPCFVWFDDAMVITLFLCATIVRTSLGMIRRRTPLPLFVLSKIWHLWITNFCDQHSKQRAESRLFKSMAASVNSTMAAMNILHSILLPIWFVLGYPIIIWKPFPLLVLNVFHIAQISHAQAYWPLIT